MKTRLSTLLLLLCTALAPAAIVDETDSEFFASMDADGDGRLDQVIVDRLTGAVRIGYQTAPEGVSWSATRVTGLDEISGVGAARFFAQNRVALALANPEANRVVFIDPSNPTAGFTPDIRYPKARGPAALAGLAMALPAVDNLFIGARLGDAPQPDTISIDGAGATLFPLPVNGRVERANPIYVQAGTSEVAGAMVRPGNGTSEFRVYNPATNPPALLASVGGLSAESAWASDFFTSGSPFAQVLFYAPGSPDLRVRTATQPAAGVYGFGTEALHTFPSPIWHVVVLPDPAGPRLLIIFEDGAAAAIFTFDGISVPVEVLTMIAPPAWRFSGASALGGGHFTLLTGPASQRRSSGFHQYRRDAAGNYSLLASGGLPVLGNHTGRANVFVFGLDPFVNPDAGIKSVLLAPDWSSQFSFFNNTVRATQETFLGGATGLANPTSASLGPTPAGGAFGMVNQVRPDAAINSFRAPFALDAGDVTISPDAGHFPNAITVTLTSRDPARIPHYRLGPTQPWQPFTAAFVVALDTVVEFYAQNPATGGRTPVRSARYTFPGSGVESDLDSDGVPDFVEIANGLGTNSGRDADGDGFSDLAEILAGTNPNDPASRPAGSPSPVFAQGFDFTVQPLHYENFAPQPQFGGDLFKIAARDLSGLTISESLVAFDPPSPALRARFTGFRAPVGPFFSVTTPGSFLFHDSSTSRLAAERVGLVKPPVFNGDGIVYTPLGGTLAGEAAEWKAAAAAFAAQTATTVAATLGPLDTLSGLVVERKLRDILASRDIAGASLANLFPHRSGADAAHAIATAVLAALMSRDAANRPAYDLPGLCTTLDGAVKNGTAQSQQDLRLVALDVYQSFEASLPANTPGASHFAMLPLDALRLFLNGQSLPADYLAASALTAAQRTSALQGLATHLSAAGPRPFAVFTLELRADTFRHDCTVMRDVSGNRDVALFDDTRRAWRFFGSITPPPGTRAVAVAYTDVPPPPPGCGVASLGIISFTITSFPPATSDDTDGDGLPDTWENALLGSVEQTGPDDPDGDGFDNEAELGAGSDPLDECSTPSGVFGTILNIARDEIGGGYRLFWDYPAAHAGNVLFNLETTTLFDGWLPLGAAITSPTPGHYQAVLPPSPDPRGLFRLRVTEQ